MIVIFKPVSTDKKWFQSNRIMRNMKELSTDMDSVTRVIQNEEISVYASSSNLFTYHFKRDSIQWPEEIKQLKKKKDSIALAKKIDAEQTGMAKKVEIQSNKPAKDSIKITAGITAHDIKMSDSIFTKPYMISEITTSLSTARMLKAQFLSHNVNLNSYELEYRTFEIQWHKILAQSIACIAMFLIGAPLGAIIKKGGLGVPVLMSIVFFIIFYVLSLMGEKWAKQGTMSVAGGMWLANLVLMSIGILFLRQARADARLFDSDFYSVIWDKLYRRFRKQPKNTS